MHPSETIFNNLKAAINFKIDSVKTVLMVDAKPKLDDMPLVILAGGSEEIEPYHNQYLVKLSLTVKVYLAEDSTAQDLTTLHEIISSIDAEIKAMQGAMTINENGQSPIERSTGLEKTIFYTEKSYLFTYTRSRGL